MLIRPEAKQAGASPFTISRSSTMRLRTTLPCLGLTAILRHRLCGTRCAGMLMTMVRSIYLYLPIYLVLSPPRLRPLLLL
eukprot:611742-Pleurochrysis_carterae.AAC.1